MEWTAAQEARLRELWAEGHSMAAIGVMMGCGKNAIAGKRNRMGLPERGSPINAASRSEQAAARRAENLAAAQRMAGQGYTARQIGAQLGVRPETVGTLLRSVGVQPSGRRGLVVGAGLAVEPAAPRVQPPREPPAPVAAHPLMRGGRVGCRWPLGEPRTPGFRYCDAADVVQGKPYCAEHCGRAYAQALRPGEALAPRGWVQ